MAGKCVDHEGREHGSAAEMCRFWGVAVSTYRNRLKRGCTLEEALTGSKPNLGAEPCTDHAGNSFPSLAAMCAHWGVGAGTFWSRRKAGWSLEECLVGRQCTNASQPCTDHEGRGFPSLKAMCRHWGVDFSTYMSRRKAGWTLGQALTGSKPNGNRRACTDHTGRGFDSVGEMCAAWGTAQSVFSSRRSSGWTLAEALTGVRIGTPGEDWRSRPCTDHLGNRFPSVSAMCAHWGVGRSAFYNRLAAGWTLEEALAGKRG